MSFYSKNDEKQVSRRAAGAAVFGTFLLSTFMGFTIGASYVGGSKAVRLMDDAHDVKQDYDKVKYKVADDYEVVADKAKESVKNMDAKDLGESATKGLKDIGGAAKKRFLDKINGEK